jgi:O-antigen/teichoic acid export membrane protein
VSHPLKKLAGQTVIYGLGNILPRFINYLFSLVLTYIFLQPAELASNTEFFSYISFVKILFTYGMETAFFNFTSKTENRDRVYSTALISILVSTLFLSLVLILFSGSLASLARYEDHRNYVVWCVLIVATDAIMAIPFARLRLNNQARRFALINFINVLVYIGINLFYLVLCKNAFEKGEDNFLAHAYDPTIGVGYAFLATLIANVVSIGLMGDQFRGFDYVFDARLWREMFAYAWPLIFIGLAGMVNETFDRIILKYLLPRGTGEYQVGIYGACYKISILMTIFIQAFRYAAEPFFFNNVRDGDSKKLNALVMKYFILFCLFLFLATTLNMPWIQVAISEKYRIGLGVVPILLLANLCLGVYYNLSIWYKLTGKTKFGAIITVIGAVITLTINFVFIPSYGYMACAWATLITYFVMVVISYFAGQKYYPVKYNLRSISVFTFLALGLYFLSTCFRGVNHFLLQLFLNNLLLLVFIFLLYKLEFDNLKKLKQTAP